jgi:uncharacterized protein YukE
MSAFEQAQNHMNKAAEALLVLDGSIVGESGESWQDVAPRAASHLRAVADYLESSPQHIPSLSEAFENNL